jgi:hypothetical protein
LSESIEPEASPGSGVAISSVNGNSGQRGADLVVELGGCDEFRFVGDSNPIVVDHNAEPDHTLNVLLLSSHLWKPIDESVGTAQTANATDNRADQLTVPG